MQPGTDPAETIAGKYFPSLNGGRMVIITDGGHPYQLHAYVSKTVGSMTDFVASSVQGLGPSMTPPFGNAPGMWANYQIAFFPDEAGQVARIGYTIWQNNSVKSRRAPAFGMTMVVYDMEHVGY